MRTTANVKSDSAKGAEERAEKAVLTERSVQLEEALTAPTEAAPKAMGALEGLSRAHERGAEDEAAQTAGQDYAAPPVSAHSGLPEDAPVIALNTDTSIQPWDHIGDDNLEDLFEGLGESGPRFEAGDVITFTFPQSLSDLPGSLDDEDSLISKASTPSADGFDPFIAFDADRQAWTTEALQLWADVADISFEEVPAGEEADIYLFAREHTKGAASANGAMIRMNVTSDRWDEMEPGGYGFDTMVHEIGHRLGLSHPGDYNAPGPGEDPISYEDDRGYIEDTDMYSIMSYWNGENTGFDYGGLHGAINTPRTHDLWVVHDYYGANWDTRDTNTTYGFNAQGVGGLFDFDWLEEQNVLRASEPGYDERGPVLTIWDGGGADDWLDLSGDDNDVVLDLAPGAFSSTHGMTKNISIAYDPGGAPAGRNALIENARGGSGDDALFGNGADNSLFGNEGDDFLIGYGGIDYFSGGLGHDTVSFSYSDADWTISLGGGFVGTASNAFGTENMLSIESIIAGGGDDDVTGSDVANKLEGGEGDDTIDARGGDDTVWGGAGADDIRGGDGDDDLSGFLGFGVNSIGDDDVIRGGAGEDTIRGWWGDDTLYGQGGDDVVYGGLGDDWISGNNGHDSLYGGGGVDTADYRYSNADWTFAMGIGTATANGSTEIAQGFEHARMGGGDDTVLGTAADNHLYGGGGADELVGYAGADLLFGGVGNDTFKGGSGNDLMSGGAGADRASYDLAAAGVVVDLAVAGSQDTKGAGFDQLISIERLTGSSHGDILSGNHLTNWISGGDGDDVIFGRGGADWLRGDDGDDILEGGDGNDLVNGGEGSDAASYFFAESGVWVNLSTSGSQNTRGAGYDVLYDIENVIGSFHNDWLTGDDGANRLTAGAGDDLLNGGAGSDMLDAGIGNDVLIGGLGVDILDGGEGVDWAHYTTGGVSGNTVDLEKGWQNTGAGGTDWIRNVENLFGSFRGDEFSGDDGANVLSGAGGNDVLFGRGGDDTLIGGAGDDTIYAGIEGPPTAPGGLTTRQPASEPPAAIDDGFLFRAFGDDERIDGFATATTAPSRNAAIDDRLGALPGSGDDTIVFKSGWGDDVIFGFTAGADVLDFSGVSGLRNLIQLSVTDVDDGALIEYGVHSALLKGVAAGDLTDADFII